MRMKTKTVSATIASIALIMGMQVIAAEKVGETGFLQDYSLLSQVDPDNLVNRVYIKEGVDWSAYDTILLDDVVFFIADDAKYKGFEAEELADLGTAFQQSMIINLAGAYEFTDTPGPGVLRIRMAVTNLVPNNSVTGTVSTIMPIGLGLSVVKKAVTGTHIGMGEVAFEGEMIDAQTGEILGAVMDSKTGEKYKVAKSISKWGHVRDVFNTWGTNLRQRLDQRSGSL